MAADPELSSEALKLIGSDITSGPLMIAATRAVLSGQYGSSVYASDILDVFQCVADDSDDIILNGFGKFNALPKYVGSQPRPEQDRRLKEIFKFYEISFKEALAAFIVEFDLESSLR